MSVVVIPLYDVPCGVCGGPATMLKIHLDERVCTVHVIIRRKDKKVLETTCWAFPGRPEPDSGMNEPGTLSGRFDLMSPTSPAPATPVPARPTSNLHALQRSA